MTNFEFYQTEEAAKQAYCNKVEQIYNGDSGTSAGRFIRWLYAQHVSEDPLSCPHCHKTDIINTSTSKAAHQMQCLNCHLSGPVCDTADEAVKSWNALCTAVQASTKK